MQIAFCKPWTNIIYTKIMTFNNLNIQQIFILFLSLSVSPHGYISLWNTADWSPKSVLGF